MRTHIDQSRRAGHTGRARLRAAFILAGALVAMAARTAQAQNAPPGSYQQSCTGAQIADGNLMANCRRADQSVRLTTLANPFGCGGDIANRDGHLTCVAAAPQPQAPTPPPGSYQQSCTDAQIADGNLTARCRRADQSVRFTTLANPSGCGGDIANRDGHLTCAPAAQQSSSTATSTTPWGGIAASDARGDDPGTVDGSGEASAATRQDAEAAAMAQCGGQARGCEIKLAFHGGCGAYASSRKHSGTGTGADINQAIQQALDDCGKRKCRVALNYCARP